ncbi:hypothetical protein ACM66B_003012 [Microbotryomycetes sp. NB124-2]
MLAIFAVCFVLSLLCSHGARAEGPRRVTTRTTHVQTVQLMRRSTPLDVSLARTRGKYGFAQPNASRKRDVGSVTLTEDASDLSYAASATIGGQPLQLVLDTGSSDLVVATHECVDCEGQVYDPTASTSAAVSDTPFSITYGSGSASGTLVTDSVALDTFTVAQQTFGACADFDNLLGGSESGLLGLGWQSLAMSGAVPFAQHLWQSGSLDEPVFGLALRSGDGTLTLGGIDSTAVAEDVNYVSLESTDSYWQIPLDGVRVNGVDVGVSTSAAIIDSGTSLMSMPAAAVSSIYAAISPETYESSGLMVYPCDANATISLSFGGVWYTVPSDSFSYGNVGSDGAECWGSVYDASEGTSDLFIIGGAFLQHVYSAFRFEPPAVGFANLASAQGASSESDTTVEDSSASIVLPDVASTVPLVAAPSSSPSDTSSLSLSASSVNPSSTTSASSASTSAPSTSLSASSSIAASTSASLTAPVAVNTQSQAAAAAAASITDSTSDAAALSTGLSVLCMGLFASLIL